MDVSPCDAAVSPLLAKEKHYSLHVTLETTSAPSQLHRTEKLPTFNNYTAWFEVCNLGLPDVLELTKHQQEHRVVPCFPKFFYSIEELAVRNLNKKKIFFCNSYGKRWCHLHPLVGTLDVRETFPIRSKTSVMQQITVSLKFKPPDNSPRLINQSHRVRLHET